jgi:hypothetical protein
MTGRLRAAVLTLGAVAALHAQRPQIGSGATHARADVSVLQLTATRAELLVTLDVDPGWHVSWRNPGETGLPTRMVWSLPAGVRVADEIWPVPHIEHTVVGATHTLVGRIPWRVTLHLDSALGRDRLLRLTMKYGVCKDVCIPEQVTAQAALVAPAGGRPASVPADLQTRLSTDAGVIPARLIGSDVLCLSRVPSVGSRGQTPGAKSTPRGQTPWSARSAAVTELVADSGLAVDAAIPLRAHAAGAAVRVPLPAGAALRDGARVLFVQGTSGAAARLDLRAPAPGCRRSR